MHGAEGRKQADALLQPKESRTKDDVEEDWGRNQALRMRGLPYRSALSWDEPLPSSSPQSSSSSSLFSVFDRYRLKGLEQRKNTGTKKAGGCVYLQPKESRTKDDEDEEDWGRNQASRMRGSSVPKRLSWTNRCLRALRNRPRRRPSFSVFDRYRLKGLEQRKNTGTKKAGGCVCLQPKESRTKDDDEEDWGRNQALRMRGSSVPKRLSWTNRCLRALRNRPRRRPRSRSLTVTG